MPPDFAGADPPSRPRKALQAQDQARRDSQTPRRPASRPRRNRRPQDQTRLITDAEADQLWEQFSNILGGLSDGYIIILRAYAHAEAGSMGQRALRFMLAVYSLDRTAEFAP